MSDLLTMNELYTVCCTLSITKLDGVGPVDNRPSTAGAPPIGKIHPFSKIAVTSEPVMRFGCPSRFRIS